jgi:beta-glucosidase
MSSTGAASLLLPAVRYDPNRGFEAERAQIERAMALGVGGFILFGGEQDAVRALTKELRLRSRVPLLIGADMERGAGQQFAGATGLPPLAAIASLDDADAIRRAARLTAREARTLGVNWDYAPVLDLDVAAENPILSTRSLGADPQRVAALGVEWITACQSEGVLACAKHFPGHGRTTGDSHRELPVVTADRRQLQDDITPFKAAVEAGVASIMTAHVAYPALDPSGLPATVSREILQWLLRQQLKFEGLVVSDALVMEGLTTAGGEASAAVDALNAGCDVLLYPSDAAKLASQLDKALAEGKLERQRVEQSLRRRQKWAQWASPPNEYRKPSAADVAWGAQLAERCIRLVRGTAVPLSTPIELVTIQDDGAAPVSHEPLARTLRAAGCEVRHREPGGSENATPTQPGRAPLLLLFGPGGRSGRATYSANTLARVERLARAHPGALLFQFGHPRLTSALGSARCVVSAWSGDPVMQQAAARWLLRVR